MKSDVTKICDRGCGAGGVIRIVQLYRTLFETPLSKEIPACLFSGSVHFVGAIQLSSITALM